MREWLNFCKFSYEVKMAEFFAESATKWRWLDFCKFSYEVCGLLTGLPVAARARGGFLANLRSAPGKWLNFCKFSYELATRLRRETTFAEGGVPRRAG